ncbi:putative ankyrin repeat protein [Megavirus courdo11]|uniref:Putative ankyrin repeat protein n=2 Tax=Megavirus TaxID=3044761 RepID=K7Z819_9VIRU|nr:putative ankyrin repeat protein [Megavirus courdo7]AFX92526.1 putative ankyrin repeat protein [Megavirus courdo11]AVL93799.1 putative ankyrin repeat protein [Megavirus vitis]
MSSKIYFTITNLTNNNISYFTEAKYILSFLDYDNLENIYIRRVSVLKNMPDSKIIIDHITHKCYSNHIILGEKYDLRNPKTFDYILKHGANIRIDNDNALMWACINGYILIVKHLIKLGADLNANLNAPITLAAESGNTMIVKYLAELGANINANCDEPIELASQNGHIETIKYLLSVGANRNKAIRELISFGYNDLVKQI